MQILYVASEVTPFAKTGGMADVAGSLPAALARLGHEVKVVMPKYAVVDPESHGLNKRCSLEVTLAGQSYPFTVWVGRLPGSPVDVLFLANILLFDRPGLYQDHGKDYPDNLVRFSAFSRATLEIPKQINWYPDIIHCNDWQTALIPVYLKSHFSDEPSYKEIGTLLTIHNLGYQGVFPETDFLKLGLPRTFFTVETLEFYGKVNLLKGGLVFADILNTVSPTYSREIQTPELGGGLHGILQARRQDLYGILNGADYQQWDPTRDRYIPYRYDSQVLHGKRLCKEGLQKDCRLPITQVPLLGVISRLTPQKGIDLILEELDELMALDLQLVILGWGDAEIQGELEKAARRYPYKLSVHLGLDESLAHRIIAGADILLMPSRYEPCGLTHLYSMRYGTIPIVRKTGGLADTVVDATPSNLASGKATGFVFEAVSGHAFLTTVRLALELYRNQSLWERLMKTAMKADFSWDRSASEYLKLYDLAVKKS